MLFNTNPTLDSLYMMSFLPMPPCTADEVEKRREKISKSLYALIVTLKYRDRCKYIGMIESADNPEQTLKQISNDLDRRSSSCLFIKRRTV